MQGRDYDFDDEARKLFVKLGLDASGRASVGGLRNAYNPMDPIYRTGDKATVFVGNQQAASNAALLKREGITHVVNCTDNMPLYHESQFKYLRFNISFFPSGGTDEVLMKFLQPMFDFVDGALAEGGSVLVHCLAGAHRAGTTGCLLLMYYGGLSHTKAVATAKQLRPVIDPIGRFPQLLQRYDAARPKTQRALQQADGAS
jgi:protein-tyrosine phosphatase